MYFPITCVDNFFDDPQEVRDLALSLEFSESTSRYPGKRTKNLHVASPVYFNYFCKKIMGIFYDFKDKSISWEINTSFQIIEPFKNNQLNKGWIHTDDDQMFAGLIYLNPSPNLDGGTSIFKPKKIGMSAINVEQKRNFYETGEENEKVVQDLEQNNEQFIETITFKNVYNRMICFGGEQYHAASSYVSEDEPRLTQVFFVKRVYADWYPVPNSKLIR